jgi:hypothetical protein
MAMMPVVADMDADVVQQRRIFEPLALAIVEAVHAPGLIEDAQREPRHLLRVFGPVAAPLAEFDDAAAADVGVALDLTDSGAVPPHVIEDEPFAQREIAQRQIVRPEAAQNRIEEH